MAKNFLQVTSSCFVIPFVLAKILHVLRQKARVAKVSGKRGRISEVPVFKGAMSTYAPLCAAGLAGIEPALLAELDFESSASINSATGALGHRPQG
jgi:hypothetical protein